MKKLSIVPNGLEEIKELYGDPQHPDAEWERENLSRFRLPFPMKLSWDTNTVVTLVTAHKLVGEAMMDALEEIRDYRGEAYLQQNRLDLFGGIYNPRKKRGIDEWSTHAWGIAIDINPHRGPLGQPSTMPEFIVEAFVKRGFEWGGNWKRIDAQHHQACTGF